MKGLLCFPYSLYVLLAKGQEVGEEEVVAAFEGIVVLFEEIEYVGGVGQEACAAGDAVVTTFYAPAEAVVVEPVL